MKCQILFSWKNKKNIISVASAELAKKVVKIKTPSKICSILHYKKFIDFFFYYISEKIGLGISCKSSAWQCSLYSS